MPMMFETSRQARFLIPMAISLAFGVLFATFITLVLVPVFYYLLNDFLVLFGQKKETFWTKPQRRLKKKMITKLWSP